MKKAMRMPSIGAVGSLGLSLLLMIATTFGYASRLSPKADFAITRITEFATGEGNDRSRSVAVSSDNRYIVFESYADNFVTDNNGVQDIVLYDTQSSTYELISVDSSENQANASSYAPTVSDDGQYVAFHSMATNLVSGDNNKVVDVFLRDRTAGTTVRISVDSSENEVDDISAFPSISDDGNLIAFVSRATDMVSGDTNGEIDVFVRNVSAGTTIRVSEDSLAVQANGASSDAKISADGKFVVFASDATNLVSGDTNDCGDIFLHELNGSTTTRISVDDLGAQANRVSWQPDINDDGQYVVFTSRASDLVSSDTNGYRDVFIRDTVNDETHLVSLDWSGAQIKGNSNRPSVSDDGRFVSFSSIANGVASDDTDNKKDVFVHDRTSGTTQLVSRSGTGAVGNDVSDKSFFFGDGSEIAFESWATNLDSNDTNAQSDIFVKENPLDLQVVEVTAISGTLDEETDTTAEFKFKRFGDLTNALTVTFAVSGTTTSGDDFTNPGTTINIAALASEATLNISLINDVTVENTESIIVTPTATADYVVGKNPSATVDITDTDKFEVSASAPTNDKFQEDEIGKITISRVGGGLGALTVDYTISGTAINGTDYTTVGSQITIPDGQTSADIEFDAVDDVFNEGSEEITVTIDTNSNYTIGTATDTLILEDNDRAQVYVQATDSLAAEGASDNGEFTVYRETASTEAITLYYVMRGTAVNGIDYTTLPGSVTIAANNLSQTITVTPIDDSLVESVEAVILELLPSDTYDLISSSRATVVLSDPEALPTVSIEATDDTGDESGNTMTYTVTRTGATTSALTVHYGVGGSARATNDYNALSGSVTIVVGNSTATIVVTPVQDTIPEASETVIVALSSRADYFIDAIENQATAFIDDDDLAKISVYSEEKMTVEGATKKGSFKFVRNGDLSQALTVNIDLDGSATEGTDYTTIGATMSFAIGEASKIVDVAALADSAGFEGNETVEVKVESGTGYDVGDRDEAVIVILDVNSRIEDSTETNGLSRSPVISGDDDIVVFSSQHDDWVASDTNSFEDIFYHDISADSVTRITANGGVEPNEVSRNPTISKDGKIIAFESLANNMALPLVLNGYNNIYIHDRVSGENSYPLEFLANRPNDHVMNPALSEDGRYLVFSSKATNLVAGDTNDVEDVFLVDRDQSTITRVSVGSTGQQLSGASSKPAISADGQTIVFQTFSKVTAEAITNSQVFLYSVSFGQSQILTLSEDSVEGNGDSSHPKISADGLTVVYESYAKNLDTLAGRNDLLNVFRYDVNTAETKLVSRTKEGLNSNGDSFSASLSENGRYISFISFASNLTNEDNCAARPLVHDRYTNEIKSLYSETGDDCGGGATQTSITSDGRTIVISSQSSTVVSGDTNGFEDIFLFGNPLRYEKTPQSLWMKILNFVGLK